MSLNVKHMINDEPCSDKEYQEFWSKQHLRYGSVVVRAGFQDGRFYLSVIDNNLVYTTGDRDGKNNRDNKQNK